ncbi:hypothetical protein Q5752_000026 [Cryptotrichosporon argae]
MTSAAPPLHVRASTAPASTSTSTSLSASLLSSTSTSTSTFSAIAYPSAPPSAASDPWMESSLESSWRAEPWVSVLPVAGGGGSAGDRYGVGNSQGTGGTGDGPSRFRLARKDDGAGELKDEDGAGSASAAKGRTRGRPRPFEVAQHVEALARVVDTSKGRDKVLKCAQYSLRSYLYLLVLLARARPLPRWFRDNEKRMRIAVAGLSLTRKCLLLLNPLHPLSALLSPAPTSARALVGHLLDLAGAVADDVYCLSKLGLASRRAGRVADRWANRLWLLTTLVGLYKLHLDVFPRLHDDAAALAVAAAERERDRAPTWAVGAARADALAARAREARREMRDAEWTHRKLLCDLVFVSYDVLALSWAKEPVQCAAGLLAALISTSKVYDQHWRAALGKG